MSVPGPNRSNPFGREPTSSLVANRHLRLRWYGSGWTLRASLGKRVAPEVKGSPGPMLTWRVE